MIRAPRDEEERLRTLYRYGILDTGPEPLFDDVVSLAASVCNTPISLISLIDKDRQWFKAKIGLQTEQMPLEQSFCNVAIDSRDDLFIVTDAHQDERFRKSPHVVGMPHIRFYASAPLVTSSGQVIGTLCVIDHVPRNITKRQRDLLRMLARQVIDALEFRQEVERLRLLSSTDALTGLHNRRAFDERLSEEFSRSQRYGTPLSLMLCDVDHFKRFNDVLGHPAGDRLLQSLARILRGCVRETDIECRYGGDELAIILPNTSRDVALGVAERLRASVSRVFPDYPQVTLSIGVVEMSAAIKSRHYFVEAADDAMYRAKRNGRNQIAVMRE